MAVLLVAAGCSDGESRTEAAVDLAGQGEDRPTTTTEATKVPAPLTGMPISAEVAARPAVSVKVDNSPEGRPQAGLDHADVIFEEKVEGGVTRFISVFQSRDADLVGPIRSLRTTDSAVVSAVGGVFVFSDGVAISLKRLKDAPVKVVSEREGAEPFEYPKGRKRPFATFGVTSRLRREAPRDARRPPALFDYVTEGEALAASGSSEATKASINYGGHTTGTFEFDLVTGTWLRSTNGTAHLMNDGSRLSFKNVIIQFVPYKSVGYKDSTGATVDEAHVVGTGDGIVLSAGKQARVRWEKAAPSDVTTFTDVAGERVKLVAGTTMVALVPIGAPVSVS